MSREPMRASAHRNDRYGNRWTLTTSAFLLLAACAPEPAPVVEPEPAEAQVETYMVGDIEVRTDGLVSSEEAYRTDEITWELAPGEGLEYKYRLEEGDMMFYSWEAAAPVRAEMHAEADGQEEGTAEFFDVIESAQDAHGMFTAPFPGIHGWYWLNLSETETVSLTLRSSGNYSYAMQFREGGRRRFEPSPVSDADDAD